MATANSNQRDFVLQTARGSLTGIEEIDSQTNRPIYRRYARIRYALPPRGDGRWRKPEPLPADWIFSNGNNHPRDYRKFGARCPHLQNEAQLEDRSEAQQDMDEDCLFLNIWVPAGGEGPRGGWPVQFDIRGGLQNSMPESFYDPIDVFRENKASPRVIVSANYRVGIFGFLASEDLLSDSKDLKSDFYAASGNFGLWDIRMALEWTGSHIHLFGGNPHNICIGGYGFLVAHQLHFDAFQAVPEKRLIRRAYFFSGAACMQPVIPQSTRLRSQFAELCRKLNIDSYTLPPEDSVRLLQGVSAEKLLQVAGTLKDGFKPVTDGHNGFVPTWFMDSIWNGELGRRLKERGVQILIGDCSGERSIYEHSNKDPSNGRRLRYVVSVSSRQGLIDVLRSFYPEEVVSILVAKYEKRSADWSSIYADIMADVQSHVATRGFVHSLFKGGMTSEDVLRYQINWNPKASSGLEWPNMNHALEPLIWWYSGWRMNFTPRDKQDVRNFVLPFARFFQGNINKTFSWGTSSPTEIRTLAPDGAVIVTEDQDWNRAIQIWEAIRDAQRRPRNGIKFQTTGSLS